MDSSQNEDNSVSNEKDETYKELADFAMLSLELAEEEENEDPIFAYMQRLKSHFQAKNPDAFRARFIKGYKILLEELNRSR